MVVATVTVLSDIHGVLPVAIASCWPSPGGQDITIPDEVTPWAAAQLYPNQLNLLENMPHPVTLDIEGVGPVVFCHGTPRDDEVVLVDARLDRWAEAFAGLPDAVRTVVCGHTHVPLTFLVIRRTVINLGCIGMPYGNPGGHWALHTAGSITLHRTSIDIDTAIADLGAHSTYPRRYEWAEDYLRETASDTGALTAFGPRHGPPT